jgi:pimeloyl-ACP methyl ester carboxylesterase
LPRQASQKLIIFVHGIGGDASSTWKNRSGRSWLDLMHDDDPAFRDFALWPVSYNSTFTIEEVVEELRNQFDDERIFLRFRDIYIIAHSMGGLVVKRLLVTLNRTSEGDKLRRIRAAIFIATPAQGSEVAEIASLFNPWNSQLKDIRPIEANSFLQSVDNDWLRLIQDRGTSSFPRSYCAYEKKPTYVADIVPRSDTATYCDRNPYPVAENHLSIVKPENTDAPIHKWVRSRILEAQELVQEEKPELTTLVDKKTTERLSRDYPLGWAIYYVDKTSQQYALRAYPTTDLVIRPSSVRSLLISPTIMGVRLPGFIIPSTGVRFFSNVHFFNPKERRSSRIFRSPQLEMWLEILSSDDDAVVWIWGFRGKISGQ